VTSFNVHLTCVLTLFCFFFIFFSFLFLGQLIGILDIFTSQRISLKALCFFSRVVSFGKQQNFLRLLREEEEEL